MTSSPTDSSAGASGVAVIDPDRQTTTTRPSRLYPLLSLIVPLLLLGLWQLVTSAGWFSRVQLPPPADVLSAGWELAKSGDLWIHIGISMQRVLLGFPIRAVLGLAAGAAIGLSRLSSGCTPPPSVAFGLRLALAQAWLFLVAAELLASSMGLGFLLVDSQNNVRTDRLLLAIVLLAVFGKITDAILGRVEKWAVGRWT